VQRTLHWVVVLGPTGRGQQHAPLAQFGDLIGIGVQVSPGQRLGGTIKARKMSTISSARTCSTTPIRSPFRS
jgi:hypothetical protein